MRGIFKKLLKVVKEIEKYIIGDVSLDVTLTFHKSERQWKKFLKEYNPEIQHWGSRWSSKKLSPVVHVVIAGANVTAWGPDIDNPEFDEEKAHEEMLNHDIPEILVCAVQSGTVKIDAGKVVDGREELDCIRGYTRYEVERVLDKLIPKSCDDCKLKPTCKVYEAYNGKNIPITLARTCEDYPGVEEEDGVKR